VNMEYLKWKMMSFSFALKDQLETWLSKSWLRKLENILAFTKFTAKNLLGFHWKRL
jgi:hypothetical protein